MNVSPNILAKNENLKKLRDDFVDERALITTTLISFCHQKTLLPFCFQKKRPKTHFDSVNSIMNTVNSELLQNCTEKQITASKATANWLFNN